MTKNLVRCLQNLADNEITQPKIITKETIITFFSIIFMSCFSVYVGAFRSISSLQKLKDSGERARVMTLKDAAIFPLILSCFLIGLYACLNFSSTVHNSLPNYLSISLTLCLFCTNIIQLARLVKPYLLKIIPQDYQVHNCLVFRTYSETMLELHFDTVDIVTLAICSVIGGFYLWHKHWIVNNLFGIAIAVNDIEFWHLNNVLNGCVLLGGLLIYDILWVFGTDVMINVAGSIEAPVVLLYPRDLFEKHTNDRIFARLGLGDVIVPGIFIALLLRFDDSLKRGQKLYFYSGLIAYILGLLTSVVICSVYKRPQPAMLYIVPPCILIPCAMAFIKGDIKDLLDYQDYPDE